MWETYNLGTVLVVLPVNDITEHNIYSVTCNCKPKVIFEDYGIIVLHNSFDRRELREPKEIVLRNIFNVEEYKEIIQKFPKEHKDYSQVMLPYLLEMDKAKNDTKRQTFRENMKKELTTMIKLITEIFN